MDDLLINFVTAIAVGLAAAPAFELVRRAGAAWQRQRHGKPDHYLVVVEAHALDGELVRREWVIDSPDELGAAIERLVAETGEGSTIVVDETQGHGTSGD